MWRLLIFQEIIIKVQHCMVTKYTCFCLGLLIVLYSNVILLISWFSWFSVFRNSQLIFSLHKFWSVSVVNCWYSWVSFCQTLGNQVLEPLKCHCFRITEFYVGFSMSGHVISFKTSFTNICNHIFELQRYIYLP